MHTAGRGAEPLIGGIEGARAVFHARALGIGWSRVEKSSSDLLSAPLGRLEVIYRWRHVVVGWRGGGIRSRHRRSRGKARGPTGSGWKRRRLVVVFSFIGRGGV